MSIISIRLADENDVEALCSLDLIARRQDVRKEYIRHSIASGTCFVAVVESEVIGYGVLNYNFFHNGNIDMLYVHSDHRRRGAGAALLSHLELQCKTPKLFTSTNLSNLPMQSLLTKFEYVVSGVINNLDEGDPEIVYFKRLT